MDSGKNGTKLYLSESLDEALACVKGTVATKKQFCFVLVSCIILDIASKVSQVGNLWGFCNDFV